MIDKDFYDAIRSQIEHEDNLCNHRMTWFISLNAFLFGAYGFSLSAESGSNADKIGGVIENARTTLVALGVLSSVATVLSLVAAQLSIYRLVCRWYESPVSNGTQFPQIIGNNTTDRRFGTTLGMLPLLSIPSMCLLAWLALKFQTADKLIYLVGAVIFIPALVSLGMMIERTRKKK